MTSDTISARLADLMAARIGSWRFLLIQSSILGLWIAVNVVVWARHWDPYPFILLNLCLSFQAAYTGPILLISANRQAARDRARDELEAREVEELHAMNRQQLLLLREIRAAQRAEKV